MIRKIYKRLQMLIKTSTTFSFSAFDRIPVTCKILKSPGEKLTHHMSRILAD